MRRDQFYIALKPELAPKGFKQSQVDGFERVLDEAERRNLSIFFIAYILATAWWESAHTMQPVREYGSEKYLQSKKYYPWVGEGLVQVTWESNHRKFGATAPGQLMTWEKALPALFDGMLLGMFTGKKLSDYIKTGSVDYVNARRIVNGTDRAKDIAKLATLFYKALTAAEWGVETAFVPKPAVVEVAVQPAPTAPQPKFWWDRFLDWFR